MNKTFFVWRRSLTYTGSACYDLLSQDATKIWASDRFSSSIDAYNKVGGDTVANGGSVCYIDQSFTEPYNKQHFQQDVMSLVRA